MRVAANRGDNPFPPQAVATFGQEIPITASLAYMRPAEEELRSYLRDFPRADRRWGGAIGLRGGHGSGKTHLLARLANITRGLKSAAAAVLYAKVDSPIFFNLYIQLFTQIERT